MSSAIEHLSAAKADICALAPLQARWVDIVAMLLEFCHDHEPAPSSWGIVGGEPFTTIGDLEIVFTAALRRADEVEDGAPVSAFASIDAREALCAAMTHELEALVVRLSEAEPVMTAAIVARAAAGAADAVYGSTFMEWFRNRGEHKLAAGHAYPTLPRDPRRWLGAHRANTPAPGLPSRDLTVVPHLRLATRPMHGVEYALDFDSWNRMSPIGMNDELVVAVGQPNLVLGEFNIHTDESAVRYTNRGPVRPQEQARLLTAIIAAAANLKTDVLVLPEYSLTDDVLEHVWPALRDLDVHPTLILSGFWEPSEHGRHLNEGWMCLPGPKGSQPHAFTTPPKLFPAPFGRFNEDIVAGSQVRVFVSERWSVAVLICRDALNGSILEQVADIGVNMLLIPAMTDKSTSMRDLLGQVPARSQAFTVLSIGPAHWEMTLPQSPPARGTRTEGAFAGPYADGDPDVAVPAGASEQPHGSRVPGPTERGLWTFGTAERVARWHQAITDAPEAVQ